MKLGIIVTTYNRPHYLRQCFESLKHSDIPKGSILYIVDDASTDQETIDLINEFSIPDILIYKTFHEKNQTVCAGIIEGAEFLFANGCDYVTNLDSDAIIKKDFFIKMRTHSKLNPDSIITGFHSINKNLNGTERHPIVEEITTDFLINKQTGIPFSYYRKKSVGGINMWFNKTAFNTYMYDALSLGAQKKGNWDHLTSIKAFESDNAIVCVKQSLVQHIGIDSSMGHGGEQPDVAADWFDLELPNVTLFGCEDRGEKWLDLKKAFDNSQKHIRFGHTEMMVDLPGTDTDPRARYSKFMIEGLNEIIQTDFVLIVQHDGYIVNHNAWTDEFLKYDYIGAKWNHHREGFNVGNGGFSLRSKKLLSVLAELSKRGSITNFHPEDHVIGITFRKYLEKNHNIKFAPSELADKFSIEAYQNPDRRYKGSFGFHGANIDFSNSKLEHIPYLLPRRQRVR